MIVVRNKRDGDVSPADVYVGRGSPLGNVYDYKAVDHPQVQFKVENRQEAIEGFRAYLDKQVRDGDPAFCDALNKIIIREMRGEETVLVCYCAPAPCHADVIKHYAEAAKYTVNWFSNMRQMPPMTYQGIEYASVENFYMAMKTKDPEARRMIAGLSPWKAKKESQALDIRPDWEAKRLDFMRFALEYKFRKGTEWRARLDSTSGPIVEWNNWNDKFYGKSVFDNVGLNWLGRILEDIRSGQTQFEHDTV